MGKIIGIDLGSYNSCVSVVENGQTIIIPNSEGGLSTPSIVSFDEKTGEIKVGDAAKRQAALNPKNTIYNIKRLIGRSYKEVKHLKMPYDIVDNDGKAAVKIGEKIYSPEEISAMILQKMKKTAEDYLGQEVKDCIITVPAYFGTSERESTKISGEIANLNVLRLISEPTAASLNIKEKKGKLYMVIDSGGCTSDFSVIDIDEGMFEVISTDGDLDLGGNLIDDVIVNYISDDFLKENGVDLRKDTLAYQRVIEAAEKCKIELSNTTQSEINLPYITVVDGQPKHLVMTLNRAKFDQLIQFYIDKTLKLIDSSIKKSGKNITDIDDILLVGGTTRIPYFVENIEKYFGKKANKSLNADTAIASGSAIQGSVMAGENNDILLVDVTALNFAIRTQGDIASVMVEANSTIPITKSQIFSTASDNQPSVQIDICTGNRPMYNDNKHLGTFVLEVPPAPRGVPQIEITFDIDANSILKVKAIDKSTGKSNEIKIEGTTSLSKEDIERMKNEAEQNAEADKKEQEKINKLNQADSLIFQTEKQISEFGDKLTETDKSELSIELNKLKEAHQTKNVDDIDKYIESLNNIWNKISTNLYQNQQNQQGSQQNETNNPEPDIQDTEFEEI